MPGLPLAGAVHHHVIAIPLERDVRKAPRHPGVERVVQEEVGQQGGDRRALGAATVPCEQRAILGLQRGAQPPLHVEEYPLPVRMVSHRLEHELVRQAVEEGLDVEVDHPVRLPTTLPTDAHRLQRRPPRPVPIGVAVESRFHGRLQVPFDDRLSNAVCHGGHPERSHPLAASLRYLNPPHWLRPIGAIKQLPAQFRFLTPEVFRQFVHCHAVYSGRALVRSYLLQRFP